ncbi:MAG TPA: FtsQ-type POTRA domain-containing protein [Nostocaceae cyanobacterium]|nr:FtsQ-type POTRA domain-containing protein [Nostocaceae cyanobacterium]
MAGIVSVSRTDLAQRRKKLRHKRRMKILQTIWRTLAVSGLAGGLWWIAMQPIWVVKAPTQIMMKSGDEVLSEKEISSLLPLSYPQSIWKIEPNAIAQSLQQHPAIAQASVSRRLFPPSLMIEIRERIPVALAQVGNEKKISNCVAKSLNSDKSNGQQLQQCLKNSGINNKQPSVGLLDANGFWMPLEKYTSINPNHKLPSLKVIGAPTQYSPYWPKIYPAISQSSIKILEIDCQDPTNLILKTEIGSVHLGSPSHLLPEQIKLLAKIRHLHTKINPSQIQYIDLKNPATPLVQTNQKNPPSPATSPAKKS